MMSEDRIEGETNKFTGRIQEGFGKLTGDGGAQIKGGFNQAKGSLLDGFGRVVDALDGHVDSVPESVRPQARQALSFAREKPIATMLGLAALTLILTRRKH
jgi:uncharacterized protein YjbJ (UPF0337 family)